MGGQMGGKSSAGTTKVTSTKGTSAKGGGNTWGTWMQGNFGGGRSPLDIGGGDRVAEAGPASGYGADLVSMVLQMLAEQERQNQQYVPTNNQGPGGY